MLRYLRRLRARHRLGTEVAIWYHAEYAAPRFSRMARIPGIEPFRGELIIGQLAVERLIRQGGIRTPRPVGLHTLGRVHTQSYLASVAEPETLGRIFGLDTSLIDVDDLLAAQRRAVGGTIAAALSTARGPLRIGVNLGGGFHHAEPAHGSGFCVFNDVAVAIAVLRRKGYRAPIAIVDLDFHQGNGNLRAFAQDETVLTYSLHGSVWDRIDAVANVDVLMAPGTTSREYLDRLSVTLPPALARHQPGLVFYLAGNDVLAGDALGSFELSPAAVLERDRRVLTWIEDLGAKTVITLAGGYSPQAWDCTVNLVRFILGGEVRAPPFPRPDRELKHQYRRVSRSLDPFELQRENPSELQLSESDIFDDLSGQPSGRRFLDYYTQNGLEHALEAYGFLDAIRARGFQDLRTTGEFGDRWRQIVRIHGCRRGEPGTYHLLVELVARRAKLTPPDCMEEREALDVLYVEWLLLQNPTLLFRNERQRLPGQEHPGLGLAHELLELLVRVCHRLDLDGLFHRPAHYHNALVGRARFRFVCPEDAGRFEAMRRVLAGLPLHVATSLAEGSALALTDGTPVPWKPADYVLPVSPRLASYIASEQYQEATGRIAREWLEKGLHVRGEATPSVSPDGGARGTGTLPTSR